MLLCLIWGGNIVSIKISNQGLPPLLAATLRSGAVAVLLWAYARLKGEQVRLRGRDLRHGVVIGVLFGLDFLFLYWGTTFTHASRAVLFLYTHPFWVAIGAHFLLPNDRLSGAKGAGLILAFAGLVAIFGSRSATLGPLFWLGDLMEVGAAIFWGYLVLLYRYAPNSHEASTRDALWGAVVGVVGWLVVANLFRLYVDNFGSYNRVYGSLGAVVLFLVFLYLTGLVILIGGETSAELGERQADEAPARQALPPAFP